MNYRNLALLVLFLLFSGCSERVTVKSKDYDYALKHLVAFQGNGEVFP
jgi:hypothetical protein